MTAAATKAVEKVRDELDSSVEKLSPSDYRDVLEDLQSIIELRIAGLNEESED